MSGKKKPVSKAAGAKAKPRARTRKSKKREKILSSYLSDSTREQLSKFGDKLSEATDKGMNVAKDVAGKVRHFASEATELTKLKIEILKLKNSKDKLFFDMGKKLWALYESKTLSEVHSVFIKDFHELERLEAAIANKEIEVSKIKL